MERAQEQIVLKVEIGNEDRIKTIKFHKQDTITQAIMTIDKAIKRDVTRDEDDYWGIYLPKQQRWAPEDMTLSEAGLSPLDTIVYRSTTKERCPDTLSVVLHKLAESSGTVIVRVKAGRDLAPKDSNGLSDPFVVVRLLNGTTSSSTTTGASTTSTTPTTSSEVGLNSVSIVNSIVAGGLESTSASSAKVRKQKFKTKTIKETLNPVWDEEFHFEVSSVLNQKLQFECWDWDFSKKNDFMGQFIVHVRQLATRGPVLGKADVLETWYPLQSKRKKSSTHNKEKDKDKGKGKIKGKVSGALLISMQLVITDVGHVPSTFQSPRKLSVTMPPASMALPKPTQDYRSLANKKVEDDYVLGKLLTKTETSEVREAHSKVQGDNTKFTVKVLHKSEIIYELREAEILKTFRHPHVVNLLGLYEDGDHYYFVMEHVDGGEVFDKIVEGGPFNELDAKEVVRQVLLALAELHNLGVAHRDLKPEKLMLQNGPDGSAFVKISGFGRAKARGNAGAMRTLCGTPQYLAPELLSGNGYGVEVDMWAVGIIAYILLTGHPPFYSDTDDLAEIFQQIMKADCKFDPRVWARISVEARQFIESLLVLDPRKRLSAKQALEHPWIIGPLNLPPKETLSPRKGSFSSGRKSIIKSPR